MFQVSRPCSGSAGSLTKTKTATFQSKVSQNLQCLVPDRGAVGWRHQEESPKVCHDAAHGQFRAAVRVDNFINLIKILEVLLQGFPLKPVLSDDYPEISLALSVALFKKFVEGSAGSLRRGS